MRILIVGAGFSGAIIARNLAEAGYEIDIIDKRTHIGGNAFDYINEHGIRVHKYGPHLFHTNNQVVFDLLSRFTEWIPYKHKVKAILENGNLVTLPVNLETINIVGKENVIDTFIRPYSEKMWGMKLEDISPDIINRVPVRDDNNEYYFPNDNFQFMPKDGYEKLFKNILNHEKINIKLNSPFKKEMEINYKHVFNSMPIDEYYDYKFGPLPYRSLKFHNINLPIPKLFPVVQINLTNNSPYTRIVEWKNIPNSGQNDIHTSLTYEEPCCYTQNNLERFYPVKDIHGINRKLFLKYSNIEKNKMTFIGRLGQYVYLDMHQCVNSAITISEIFLKNNRI